jgi:hypothetical protein
VVGLERPIEILPGHLDDLFVRAPEVVEKGRALGRVLGRELDLRQQRARPRLPDEEWTGVASGLDGEPARVDRARALGEGVDPESRPREIDEGESGENDEVDARVGTQARDGGLRDEWGAGDGEDDLTELLRSSNDGFDDRGVRLGKGLGALVVVVERDRARVEERERCGVTGGPQVDPGSFPARRCDRSGDVLRSCGSEADRDDDGTDRSGSGGAQGVGTGVIAGWFPRSARGGPPFATTS